MQHLQEIPISTLCKPAQVEYTRSSYSEMFEALQFLRQHEVFCDIKLETENGCIIFGHKAILASASPYFHTMFTNFAEMNKDLVVMRQLDAMALQLLVDFIYSGKIIVTERNVQALLAAANFLQINEVNEVCCAFLQKQLNPKNCLGIKAFADLHSFTELLTSSELYIQKNFSEVVEADEFLFLSFEQVVELISSDEITVPSEEKVFECVIRWVEHELDARKCIFHQLLEHVRLPLISEYYILQKVLKEPLLNNCAELWKGKDFISEALDFHLLKKNQSDPITIPECIRFKPRLPSGSLKMILVIGGYFNRTEWYDSKVNQWQFGPKMIVCRYLAGVAVLKDNFVFVLGGYNVLEPTAPLKSAEVLDLSLETLCWKPTVDMLVKRRNLAVGVINNHLYAVGGSDGTSTLNSAEVFDYITQEWRMISSMSTYRTNFGVGVLNNLLYAVGGHDSSLLESFNSVECYDPSLDTWKPVAKMSVRRRCVGVAGLNGLLYAVGGHDGYECLKSVEAYCPRSGVWTTIPDMNFSRLNCGVVALNGLLYVVGGHCYENIYSSVEFYNPISNTWSMLEASMKEPRIQTGAVAIGHKPYHF